MRLVPERSPFPRVFAAPLALAGPALLWLARHRGDALLAAVHCPLRDVTGVPCFTCGATHALTALAAGRWAEAWAANPAVPLGAVLVGAWIVYGVPDTTWPRWRRQVEQTPSETRAARWLAALAIAALWLRQIVRLG